MACPDCGQPKHEAYNPDAEGWYSTRTSTCAGCAAVAAELKGHEGDDHALKLSVIDDRPPDVALLPWIPD